MNDLTEQVRLSQTEGARRVTEILDGHISRLQKMLFESDMLSSSGRDECIGGIKVATEILRQLNPDYVYSHDFLRRQIESNVVRPAKREEPEVNWDSLETRRGIPGYRPNAF